MRIWIFRTTEVDSKVLNHLQENLRLVIMQSCDHKKSAVLPPTGGHSHTPARWKRHIADSRTLDHSPIPPEVMINKIIIETIIKNIMEIFYKPPFRMLFCPHPQANNKGLTRTTSAIGIPFKFHTTVF